ncbi:hypothetical protein VCM39_14720 [Bacteroides sp. CG01]|uniref:hypothetical protein n=1 Tax=Bacteroides TaxID=816 RepID=UPI002A91EB9A|nr:MULTISPECIES: hypothetical protein [Bacteroides]
MKYGVNRQVLLITAGIVWIVAGANILRIGIVTWLNDSQYWLFKMGEATVVFLLFFILIFRRLYYKHTERITQKKQEKNCPFSFFDVKSWIVMIFMISLGISIRSLHLLPTSFISVFYTGLSLALIATGVLFIRYWWQRRHLLRN